MKDNFVLGREAIERDLEFLSLASAEEINPTIKHVMDVYGRMCLENAWCYVQNRTVRKPGSGLLSTHALGDSNTLTTMLFQLVCLCISGRYELESFIFCYLFLYYIYFYIIYINIFILLLLFEEENIWQQPNMLDSYS